MATTKSAIDPVHSEIGFKVKHMMFTNVKGNFEKYYMYVNKYHAFLVTENNDKQIKELDKKPGSIPYLAMVSHGLSHTQFWPDVEKGLKSAFSSGKNPGYVKK